MNEYLAALILGLVQGLTEFLPISSTGHLIIFEKFFGFPETLGLTFDISVHVATALAILYFFKNDWKEIFRDKKLLVAIAVGTFPAVIIGLLFEDYIASSRSLGVVATGLLAGSVIILVAEWTYKKRKISHGTPSISQGLVVGFFQALALIPGISRSGATISGALFLGKNRSDAARFSFLLSTPIIFAAAAKQLAKTEGVFHMNMLPIFAVGFCAAFFAGLCALRFLTKMMKRSTLLPFVWYRIILAALLLWLL